MNQITAEEFKDVIAKESGDPTVDFINVCTPAEYAAEHIEGVRSVPLGELASHLAEFKDKKKIYVHCRSGGRSAMAANQLASMGVEAELINVAGGLNAWGAADLPTKSS